MARDDTRTDRPAPGRTGGRSRVVSSLTVLGALLVVLGSWSILRTSGVVPNAIAEMVGDWWGAALVLAGGWLVWQGRRAAGTMLVLLGTLHMVFSLVPGPFIAPVVLIGIGVAMVVGTLGRHRWLGAGSRQRLEERIRGTMAVDAADRSIMAVFNDASAAIDAAVDDHTVVECLAVFGDVNVTVPHDVAVELRETAVFGDVRSPEPPSGTPVAVVQIRATAVFGDVRIQRN